MANRRGLRAEWITSKVLHPPNVSSASESERDEPDGFGRRFQVLVGCEDGTVCSVERTSLNMRSWEGGTAHVVVRFFR